MNQELLEILKKAWVAQPDKPDETPENTLDALAAVAGADAAKLRALVEKRASGIPLAHLTGKQKFMGIELLAGPEALIPRKETEIVCNAALEKLKAIVKAQGSAKVIDVCCGSGNISLALAYHEPKCEVFAADISEDAVGLAKRNAAHLKLESRAHFFAGDLLAPVAHVGKVDLLTCNPPYISSGKVDKMADEISKHEPRFAFDGGPFGIKILRRIISEAPAQLKPGGWLAFEVGLGQGKAMEKMLRDSPDFEGVEAKLDHLGEVRALVARAVSAKA